MEVIKWPQSEIQTQFADCQQLKDIILKLEESARSTGKVVCRVTVNGLALSEGDEERFATTQMSEIRDLEVEMESVGALVRGTLDSLREYVDDLREACLEGAERFRESGPTTDANKLFTDIVNGARWLTDALMAVKVNWLHYSSAQGDFAEDWAANEKHMIGAVRELLAAFEKQDFVLVSDVLEYELSTSMERWLEILDVES
jgi:hypothetical protein